MENLDFGQALDLLKQGEKVARSGWNGKGMFLYLVPANSYPAQTGAAKSHWGEKICSHIEKGWSLRRFCQDKRNPSMGAVLRWLKEDIDFQGQYAHAREVSADADADHVGFLGEQASLGHIDPNAARVAIDARKWSAGQRNPKKYGPKLDLTGQIKHMLPTAAEIAAAQKAMDDEI